MRVFGMLKLETAKVSATSLDRDDDKFAVVNRLSPSPNIFPIWNRFKPSVHVLSRFLFYPGRKRLDPIAKTLVVTAPLLNDVTSAFIDRYIGVEWHHAFSAKVASVRGLFPFDFDFSVRAVSVRFEDSLNGSIKLDPTYAHVACWHLADVSGSADDVRSSG